MPRITGKLRISTVAGEQVRAFLPAPLPPAQPPLVIDDRLATLHAEALAALGKLAVAGAMVPSPQWFLYGFVRKEAVVSSEIEGTQATLQDVVTFEATRQAERPHDVREVCNYVDALTYTRQQLASPTGLPLSSRLLCEAHKLLMRGVRGEGKLPGEVRRSQNWIGGTRPGNARFVPPPPDALPDLLSQIDAWLHSADPLPPLIKAGLAHVQFETIHPFLDGNGRLGRLLITLLLCSDGVLTQPILYLSLHFKRHRALYYDLLQDVRLTGDWERWCEFFLEGVTATATQAADDARKILDLLEHDRARIARIGRAAPSALKVHAYLFAKPYLSIPKAATELGISVPAATTAVRKLVELDVLRPTTAQARNRIFAYEAYLAILAAGTEPLR